MGDKRQITVVFCGAMSGEFAPPQIIYQGKTPACLPHQVTGMSRALQITAQMRKR